MIEQKFKLGQKVYYMDLYSDGLIQSGMIVTSCLKSKNSVNSVEYSIDGCLIVQDNISECKEILKKHHIEITKQRINKEIERLNLELEDTIKKIEENNND